jgi:poly(hydroxyalkanoate) depolymerase family esterase
MNLTPPSEPPTWRARWLRQKTRLANAGREFLRTMRQAVSGSQAQRRDRRRPTLDERAAFAAAGVDAQAIPAQTGTGPQGSFTEGRFATESQRRYMLYQPASRKPGPAPLLVLLHGCRQSAEDFAAGTRMNEAAEDTGVLVLYPEQSLAGNLLRCWNWYALQDRSNSDGDAALIAAMTRHIISEHGIDAKRVYVAGMSAGGGMAAVLARDYPELYAALGVHSGVPAGLAHDVFSAIRLMSNGPAQGEADAVPITVEGLGQSVASIVFHGDEDKTVHPSNGEAIHAAPGSPAQPVGTIQATTEPRAGQRGFTRSVEFGPGGVTKKELWIVHGAGHAWAGGSDDARYTDADGPSASREMLRFFLQHRLIG